MPARGLAPKESGDHHALGCNNDKDFVLFLDNMRANFSKGNLSVRVALNNNVPCSAVDDIVHHDAFVHLAFSGLPVHSFQDLTNQSPNVHSFTSSLGPRL